MEQENTKAQGCYSECMSKSLHFALIGQLVALSKFTTCHTSEMGIQLLLAIKVKVLKLHCLFIYNISTYIY